MTRRLAAPVLDQHLFAGRDVALELQAQAGRPCTTQPSVGRPRRGTPVPPTAGVVRVEDVHVGTCRTPGRSRVRAAAVPPVLHRATQVRDDGRRLVGERVRSSHPPALLGCDEDPPVWRESYGDRVRQAAPDNGLAESGRERGTRGRSRPRAGSATSVSAVAACETGPAGVRRGVEGACRSPSRAADGTPSRSRIRGRPRVASAGRPAGQPSCASPSTGCVRRVCAGTPPGRTFVAAPTRQQEAMPGRVPPTGGDDAPVDIRVAPRDDGPLRGGAERGSAARRTRFASSRSSSRWEMAGSSGPRIV